MNYDDFISSKKHVATKHGITPTFIPDYLFDFQKYGIEYAIKKGRCGIFFDTGLGKTIMELVIAKNFNIHTNKPTLIITPLAVAFQFEKECRKFDISSIEYSKDGNHHTDIVLCNYERLSKFNKDDFGCVILDESSILKNFKGSIKNNVTHFLKKIKYKFLFTATPSPNDFIELGTSSEALGYLGYTDMLTKFFTNNQNTISPQNFGTKWILKGHAYESFFNWVSSWSISMRKPSDLGFNDTRFLLPDLIRNDHLVKNKIPLCIEGQYRMFNLPAKSFKEIAAESRNTVRQRCEKAVEVSNKYDTSVYWCHRDDEGYNLSKIDPNAFELKGSMKLEKKEEILLAFVNGEINKLITKPKITAFGLNWQHCHHTTYFPTYSYEQFYQSIRRFWRFGQKENVVVDMIYSDGQQKLLDSILAKTKKANSLFDKLNNATRYKNETIKQDGQKIILPTFL